MSLNKHLNRAKVNRNDEFYTQYKDIEQELQHHKHHFKNKTVYCNCDDPRKSNFSKYFQSNFKELELKKLIVSCYDTLGDKGLVLEYTGDKKTIDQLQGNGDFRNEENIEYLKKADIVVTNPPFSLFREYIAQLVEYDKNFLIMGNNNAITYEDIFPLLKENKMWLGYHANTTMEFEIPDNYERWDRIDEKTGKKYGKVPAISWFTNLDVKKRHEEIILYEAYSPEKYPKYDNYDAINVDRVAQIPQDYDGIMGVPITFMTKYNPDQFEILGLTTTSVYHDNNEGAKRNKVYENVVQHSINGKQSSGSIVNCSPVLVLDSQPENKVYYTTDEVDGYLVAKYARILIKNKKKIVEDENKVETELLSQIKEVLLTFPKYWEEDVLLRNKVAEDLRNYNKELIEALLSNKLVKDTYSITLDSTNIFKIEEFISMLRYKNYWENSYTKYSNEIGLTSEGKYLNYNTDVVLDFPHKDSILEGETLNKEEKENGRVKSF